MTQITDQLALVYLHAVWGQVVVLTGQHWPFDKDTRVRSPIRVKNLRVVLYRSLAHCSGLGVSRMDLEKMFRVLQTMQSIPWHLKNWKK